MAQANEIMEALERAGIEFKADPSRTQWRKGSW